MPPPITEFVDVTVNLAGATADAFGFGRLLGAFTFAVPVGTTRQFGPFFSIQEVIDAGFDAATEPAINAWATTAFSQENGIDQVLIGQILAADADLTVSLDAIELADANSWYITNIDTRTDADLALFGTWTEARNGAGGSPRKIGKGQSTDLTVTAFLAWQTATLNRSSGWVHDDDTEYLDGGVSSKGGGFNLDAPAGVGDWIYEQISGVPANDYTGAEALAIYAADANLLSTNKGLAFTSKGTMASGRFIDVTTTIDWLAVRTEEAVLGAFVGAVGKIPYTNAGINIIAAAVQGVLDLGVSAGHFAPSADSLEGAKPVVTVPNVLDISASVKATRVLTLTATATIAGSIQKLEMIFNLTF